VDTARSNLVNRRAIGVPSFDQRCGGHAARCGPAGERLGQGTLLCLDSKCTIALLKVANIFDSGNLFSPQSMKKTHIAYHGIAGSMPYST
jgi:hypothetical protein